MSEVLKIAICEDNDNDASILISYIEDVNVSVDITRFEAGEELLSFLDDNQDTIFDLIFLDIFMKDLNGMDTARKLRDKGVSNRIIFCTTSTEFSLDAFDVDAEQYLLKPIKRDGKLEKILTKHLNEKSKIVSVDAHGNVVNLNLGDVMYIESAGHSCIVHLDNELIDTSSAMTMDNFAKLFTPPRFIRCHRSYIVNLSYVEKLEEDFIMKNGDTVYIRRMDYSKIKKAYLTWLLDDAANKIL